MLERVLIGVVVTVHYGFVLYLIIGGFLAWRWRITIWTHLAAAAWGVLIVTVGAPCPLTAAQNWLRDRQGQPPLRTGFIQQYVTGTFYPAGAERLSQVVVGLVIVVSWIGYVRRRPPGGATSDASASRPDSSRDASARTSSDGVSDQ